MITTENEFYIRFVLLLIEGGTDVLRVMLKHDLEKKKITFENFLSQVKCTIQSVVHITKKQLELLYPVSKEPPDLNKCDISILAYLLNEFLTIKGSSESKAVNTIKKFRNDFFARPKTASLDEKRFKSIWHELSTAIFTLCHDCTKDERERFKETIEQLSNDALDINSALETLRTLDQIDEFYENINIRLTQLDQAVQYCHKDIELMKKQITELQKTFGNQGMSTKVVNTVFGSLRLSALEQKTIDEAERVLLSVSKESLSHLEPSQSHKTVRETVDNLVHDMNDKGLKVEDVSEGSIVFTIKCQSFDDLIALIDYFDSSMINNHLDAISCALSEVTGQKIEIHAMISTDRLSEELRRHEKNGNNETDENDEIFQVAVEKLALPSTMSNTSTRTYQTSSEVEMSNIGPNADTLSRNYLNEITNENNGENDTHLGDHCFMFVAPKDTHCGTLEVKDLQLPKGKNKQTFPLEAHSHNLYEVSTKLLTSHKYKIKYVISRQNKLSKTYIFQTFNDIIHRDMSSEDGVQTHMIDIISCDKCHKKYKDDELIGQMQCVLKRFSNGKFKTADNLLSTVYNNCSSDRSNYLFLVVLALFCSFGYHQEVRNIVNKLNKQSAAMLANALSGKLLNGLQEELRRDMISICRLLSDIILCNWCPFEYVIYFLQFFGHETGFQVLQELSTTISEANYHKECCFQLCEIWYGACFVPEEEIEIKMKGISFILGSIKPELVVYVYDKLKMPVNESCSKDEEDIDLELKKYVKSIINRSIQKCKIDLEAIIHLSLLFFRERLAEKSEFCEMFENAIIERLGYCHLNVPANISRSFESLIENTYCFSMFKQQEKLLKKVIDSDNELIFNFFIELFRCERIRECYSKLNLRVYKDWLDRYPKMRQRDLAHILQRFIDIKTLTHNIKRPDVESLVVDKSMEDLQSMTLEDIFQNLQNVGHLCEGKDEVSNLLIANIEKNIQRIEVNSFEFLTKMTGTERKLVADYRIVADIICVMMKHFMVKQSDQTDEDYFIALEKQAEFLKAIQSVTGKYQHQVTNYVTYKESMACITGHVKTLFELKVRKKLLKHFKQSENALKLLQLGGKSEITIIHQIKSAMKIFDKAIGEISSLGNVLNVLLERKMLILQTTRLKEKSNDILRRISQGGLTSDECDEKSIAVMLGCNENTLGLCKEIGECIKSETFWNLGKHIIDKFVADIEKVEKGQTQEVEMLLKCLKEEGIQIFKSGWLRLDNKDTNLKMRKVNLMFKGSNILNEISLFEQGMDVEISTSTKRCLKNLYKLDDIEKKVDAMMSVYSVFYRHKDNDDDFIKLIKQFKELVQGDNLLDCPFPEFQSLLETISSRTDKFNEVTVSVMTVLGESFNLLQFLAEIADADIRTLIDAGEYISEQHIQGRTVSALIEVKRFVHPLLDNLGNEKLNIDWLFETIETQIKNLGTNAKELHLKIDDCNRNIHNLKSLYNRVCNRGEQTKEVVSNFNRKSKIKFVIFKEERQVCFYSIYEDETTKHDNEIINKKEESTLIDYRSRALLLKNAEWNTQTYSFNREDRAELELFINSINLCMDIKEILSQLLVLGHIEYTGIKLDANVSKLQQLKCNLETKYSEWSNELENERNSFYLLNFVQGFEIHALYDFFRNGKDGYTAETILKSIHPLIKADKEIRGIYDKVQFENKLVIRNIGHVLHAAHQGIKRFKRSFPTEASTSKMSDIVHKGYVRIINIGDQARSVFQTVLALYRNTTQTLPETHQLLICRRSTRWEEVHLLLARCFGAFKFYDETPLFCLVSVDILERSIQDKLAQAINNVSPEDNFLLSIICKTSESIFELNKIDEMETVSPLTDEETTVILRKIEPHVCTYSSELAGLGKTSTIYQTSLLDNLTCRTLHISGQFSRRKGIKMLQNMRMKSNQVLHLDISLVSKPDELDLFLSELILLQYISDDKGSFFLSTKHIAIEIANSINNELIDSLTIATLFQRKHITFDSYQSFTPSLEINSPLQVVCHYLRRLKLKEVDENEIDFSRHANLQPISAEECRDLLENAYPLTKDTSYNTIYIFLNVLSDQLKRLSASPFFRNIHIADMIGKTSDNNIRSTVVEMMINTAKEFSTRSVATCRYLQVSSLNNSSKYKLHSSEYSVKRTDEMIQWQSSNHLIFYLHHDSRSVNVLYRDISKVRFQLRKFFENQMNEKLNDYMKMSQEELQEVVQKVGHGMSHESQELPEDYVLTPDNVLKMVIILMRINAQVPVLLMGETGCGKTTLVKYLSLLCKIPFSELRIHAGLASEEIEKTVFFMHKKCCEDHTLQRWLFLDEVNTTEQIGMISDMICHKQCNGTLLAPNLVIIGACNPYKMKSESQLKATGLKGKLKFDSLSKLVYRVHPLTESMLDYVWDFGYLSDTDERMYIQRMMNDVSTKEKSNLLIELIASSQKFVRESEKSEFAVSLRDVYRCKVLIKWFTDIIPQKHVILMKDKEQILENATILSLTHCYHCRFSGRNQRTDFRKMLVSVFLKYNYSNFTQEYIYNVMKTEQNDILERMNVPAGIAKNTALRENVFMLFVCILNKIPIFLVGKPGCSKSLAIQLIRSNLRGQDSTDPFFKTLPQLYCVSFQGTESSTSDGIKKVFEKAEQYQKTFTDDNILSVVILDEIGLAEISQFNPLKILHNLLEPARGGLPNVAVVGISNWALDASKMNRAVHVSRPDMDIDELKETGISISESFTKDVEKCQSLQVPINDVNLTKMMEILLHNIAKSYKSYIKTLKFKSFFGLRDFYSLVKFVTRAFSKERFTLNSTEEAAGVILEGLQRNFGGLPAEHGTLMFHFRDCFRCELPKLRTISDLISDNVIDISARHLMLITKSDSMIASLEYILNKSGRKKIELIFGSHFEEDLTDDYNYRILNRIIMCMEQGVVLILKNLEKIYGSLYDMLNQNYTRIGKHNSYCRVALGPYSNPFAHVSDSFRCIVIVDERKLDYADPPFLNRFEKQHMTYDDLLSKDDIDVATELDNWLDKMCTIIGKSFEKKDILPIYNNELMKTLVLKQKGFTSKTKCFKSQCKKEMMWLFRPEAIVRLSEAVDIDIQHQSDQITKKYFALPIHEGIAKYVQCERDQILDENHLNRSIVFTYSNISSKVEQYFSKWDVQFEKLQTFKSEKQLRTKIQSFWESENSEILFLQCSGKEDERNIMLCKNIMECCGSEWIEKKSSTIKKQIYLVIHLVGEDSNVVEEINFLSGWKMVMMDSLEPNLLYLCKTSLLKVVENKRPLSHILKNELFWAFTKIRYGSSGRQNEEIGTLVGMLNKSDSFLCCLEERIFADIKNRCKYAINLKWQLQVASDVTALKTSSNFTEALNRFILDAIKHPLAKVIFLLESKGAIHSYFAKDDDQLDRQRLWEYLFEIDRIVSIKEIQDGFGPCCYICERVHGSLRMPFSQVIFETIEAKRDIFIEDMSKLRSQSEIDDDECLPDDIMNELVNQLDNYIFGTIPYIKNLEYRNMKEDYISDFCTLVSFTAGVNANSDANQMAIQYMKWAIQKKMSCKSDVFARLHIIFWTNQNMFRAILQFLDASYSEADHDFFVSLIKNDNFPQSESSKSSTHSSEEINRSLATYSDEFGDDLNTLDPFYQFLAEICRYFIPTTMNLLKKGNLSLWHFRLKSIFAIAPYISPQPRLLFVLRFCDDVFLHLNDKMPKDILGRLGDILTTDSLDSESTSKTIITLLEIEDDYVRTHKLECKSPKKRHVIISQYLIRCLQTNSKTLVYGFLFDLIQQSTIPDSQMDHFRCPLFIFLQLENTYYGLSNLVVSGEKWNRYSGAKKDESERNFLSRLDKCLIEELRKKGDSAFCILITDLLKRIFLEEEIKEYPQLISNCVSTLQVEVGGLKRVASLAFLKMVISNLPILFDENSEVNQEIICCLDSMFVGLAGKDICNTLKVYLLKVISFNVPLHEVIIRLKRYAQKIKSIGHIHLNDKSINNTFEMNPLAVFCTDHGKKEIQLLLKEKPQTLTFEYLISIMSSLIRVFYLKTLRRPLRDTEKRKKDETLKEIQDMKFSDKYFVVVEALLDRSRIITKSFTSMEGIQTSSKEYFQLLVIGSLYALSVSNPEEDKVFMTKCLTNPCSLASCYIPGFSDEMGQRQRQLFPYRTNIPDVIFSECRSCELRLAFNEKATAYVCPVCNQTVQSQDENLPEDSNFIETKGFVQDKHDDDIFTRIRNISPLSKHILQFLVKCNILGSFTLKFCAKDKFTSACKLEKTECTNLYEQIKAHWNHIATMINCDDFYVSSFLLHIMHRSQNVFFFHHSNLETPNERKIFEEKFEKNVQDIIKNGNKGMLDFIRSYKELPDISTDCMEFQIREADDITTMDTKKRIETLPGLFRKEIPPDTSHLLYKLKQENSHRFLQLVITDKLLLTLPKHIYNLIQWHMITVANTCYMMKSYECSTVKVLNFLDSFKEMRNQQVVKKRFEAFKNTWNELSEISKHTDILPKISHINSQSILSECLVIDEHSLLFELLSSLVRIQNNVLDYALAFTFNSSNLDMLWRGNNVAAVHTISVTDTRQCHFIDMTTELADAMDNWTHSELGYGKVGNVFYDFDHIEQSIVAEILVGKLHINIDTLPNIIFIDHMYRHFSALVEDIRLSTEQEPLPFETENLIIENIQKSNTSALNLLHYLDMLMTLLRKTKLTTEGMTLVEFAEKKSSIICRPFPKECLPNPEDCVKVSHIVSLHELLEEMCAFPLLDGLAQRFCIPVEPDIKQHFEKMPSNDIGKAKMTVKAMKLFVYRCMSMNRLEPDQQLLAYLSDASFWPPCMDIFEDKRKIELLIPLSVMVGHVRDIVCILTDEIKRETQSDQRMMSRLLREQKDKIVASSSKDKRKKIVSKLKKY